MGRLEEGQVLVSEAWRDDVNRRLDEHMERLDKVDERLERGSARFAESERERAEIREMIETNTALTATTRGDVKELLEVFAAFRGFVKVSGWAGIALKWIAILLICAGAIWWTIKTGELPKPPKEPF